MKPRILQCLLFITVVFAGAGCKKQIEKAKTDAVIDAMVANKWVVLQYTDGGNDVSAEFSGYDFQFNRDYTVVGSNGTTSKTGTWNGDATAQIISANFANTPAPLSRLNGTWAIYYYDSNGPKFNQTINGVEMRLVLRKK